MKTGLYFRKFGLFILGAVMFFAPVKSVSADASLVGLWHANENGGTTLFDSSGKGNDGALNWDLDNKIASFNYTEPANHFSDLCYDGNSRFLYVYAQYTVRLDGYVKAIFLKRDTDSNSPTFGKIVLDPNNPNPETTVFDPPTSGIMAIDPSCHYFDDGINGGKFYIGFTHFATYADPIINDQYSPPSQHVMVYEENNSNGWNKIVSTYWDQYYENDSAGGKNFLAIELFDYNNRLMGIGTYGKERSVDVSGTPLTTNLRVYDFTTNGGEFYAPFDNASTPLKDNSLYLSSPSVVEDNGKYYIAYYKATGTANNVMLVSTTNFANFTGPVDVSFGVPNIADKSKWPAITKLADGGLFVAFTSDIGGQQDLVYRTSKPPYTAFSGPYGNIGDGAGNEYYASMVVDSDGETVLSYSRTTSGGVAQHYFTTNANNWATDGKVGSALSFNGIDDYVDLGNNGSLQITGDKITVSAWINPSQATAKNGNERIVGKGITGDGNPFYRYLLYRKENTGKIKFGISTGGANSYALVESNIDVVAGEWTHVVGVYDGSNIYIYINGERNNSIPKGGNIGGTTEPVVIGANTSVSPTIQVFDGKIDEVAIFNNALTETEVKYLYRGTQLVTRSLPDIDGNGVDEIAVLNVDPPNTQAKVVIKDASTGYNITTISFSEVYLSIDMVAVPDINGNGASETAVLVVGALGSVVEGQVKVLINDALSGNWIKTLAFDNNYSNYPPIAMAVVPDVNGNGASEIAVLGVGPDGFGRITVTDVLSGGLVKNIYYSWFFPPIAMAVVPDINGNGVSEIAVLAMGAVGSIDEGQVWVIINDVLSGNGAAGTLIFDENFPPIDMAVVPDFSGNGASEIAVLGVRESDGAIKVDIKDTLTATNVGTINLWAAYPPVGMAVIPDFSGGLYGFPNGASEIAVLGVGAGQYEGEGRVIIKDPLSSAWIKSVYFGTDYLSKAIVVLDDFAETSASEIAVLGVDNTDSVKVTVKDSHNAALINWFLVP